MNKPTNSQSFRPLGMPNGSVRAILALTVVIVACQQMLTGGTPSVLLSETLVIVLTHYFAARQNIHIGAKLRAKLKSTGDWPQEEKPLWLPHGTIRSLITAAFLITVIMLIEQERLLDSNVLTLLAPFAAYLLGTLLRQKREEPESGKPRSWFARASLHLSAILVVGSSLILLMLAFNNMLPAINDWIASLLLSTILYYFGTR